MCADIAHKCPISCQRLSNQKAIKSRCGCTSIFLSSSCLLLIPLVPLVGTVQVAHNSIIACAAGLPILLLTLCHPQVAIHSKLAVRGQGRLAAEE